MNVKDYTKEQVAEIVKEARAAAFAAADKFFLEQLGGEDRYACGFAWVNIYGVKGNTRVGRALIENDVRKSYDGGLQLWNPSRYGCQNVDTLEAGAEAAAQVFRKYGFEAFAGSRLD